MTIMIETAALKELAIPQTEEGRTLETFEDTLWAKAPDGVYRANFQYRNVHHTEVYISEGYLRDQKQGTCFIGAALASGKPGAALYGFLSRYYRIFNIDGVNTLIQTTEYDDIMKALGLERIGDLPEGKHFISPQYLG